MQIECSNNSDPVGIINKIQSFLLKIPRIETTILLVGFLVTVVGKPLLFIKRSEVFEINQLIYILFPDIILFGMVYIGINLCLYWRPSRHFQRFWLVFSFLITLWAILNIGWLFASGVQLQPGILIVLIKDPREIWPLLQAHLVAKKLFFALVTLGIIIVLSICMIRFFSPQKLNSTKNNFRRRFIGTSVCVSAMFFAQAFVNPGLSSNLYFDNLSYSSHWQAIKTLGNYLPDTERITNVPYVGQREIILPSSTDQAKPNVIILLLESVSYAASGLGDPSLVHMPFLESLAKQGVEFTRTYAPVPMTTKAHWSTLTGTTPIIKPNYVEAIPGENTYESLPSILKRNGYTSGFFEMSKGNFECAPGLFHNLNFDIAWFRENLEDPSTYLGYLSGDDCKIIEPAFDWVQQQNGPFLLTMITTVAHHPFVVPASFEPPAETPYERYLQTLRYSDLFLKKVFQKMESLGLTENSIVCILGDHGCSFSQDQGYVRWYPSEDLVRIPWVMLWPGHIEADTKRDGLCSQIDVTPTLLNLMGYDIQQANFDGLDVLNKIPDTRRVYFSSWLPDSPRGFVEADRKWVYRPSVDKMDLYHLDQDPQAMRPVEYVGGDREKIQQEILHWANTTQISISPTSFTEQILFDHWQTFSSGQRGWAYYVP